MRIVLLGGTGFIGRHVAAQLAAGGQDVTVTHRGKTEPPPGVRAIVGDRDDPAAVARRCGVVDVVIDMIPMTRRDAERVVGAFRGVAGRAIAISSCDVYRNYDGLRNVGDAPPDVGPLDEDAPLREHRYPYRSMAKDETDRRHDYDKIEVEQIYLGDARLPGTALRLPMVYGPGDRQHRLHEYLRRIDDGRPFILMSDEQAAWRTTRGYVEDVAAAIAAVARSAATIGKIYNVGEPSASNERSWAERVAQACGWTGRVVTRPEATLPESLRGGVDWRYDLAIDTGRLRTDSNWSESVPTETALRRTIEWERANPPGAAEPVDYAAEDVAVGSVG